MSDNNLSQLLAALKAIDVKFGETPSNDSFAKAQAVAVRIKAHSDSLLREGAAIREVGYGLILNATVNAYIENYGNRARTRDEIGELLDNLLTNVEDIMVKRGIKAMLSSAEDSKRKGDMVETNRILLSIKTKLEGIV